MEHKIIKKIKSEISGECPFKRTVKYIFQILKIKKQEQRIFGGEN